MPRRSELGWVLVMVVVAVTLGFFIGGGPSLLTNRGASEALVASTDDGTATTTTTPTTTTTADSTTTTTVALRPPAEVQVRVYNGSRTPGQAVRVGDKLEAAGYAVLEPGPSPSEPRPSSAIHFVEGFAGEAAALAAALGLPAASASPMPSPAPVGGVGPAQLVVIVADDLQLAAP